MEDIRLRAARSEEATRLSDLAFRSKAHWGYSAEFMEACRAELSIDPAQIQAGGIVVATMDEAVVGFFALVGEFPVAEIDALFVDPVHLGAGVGARLFAALRDAARAGGFTRLRIESDPNAVGFYERQGAAVVGEAPSGSVAGRMLPVLELSLSPPGA